MQKLVIGFNYNILSIIIIMAISITTTTNAAVYDIVNYATTTDIVTIGIVTELLLFLFILRVI